MNLLKIDDIHTIAADDNNKEILKGLNLEINEGETHVIMGPNGSGKSTLAQFLKSTKQSITGEKPSIYEFIKETEKNMNELKMKSEYTSREFNVGFSGGEKKKNEILQMLMLKPRLAILDETDSGLDVDAIKTVVKGINLYKNDKNSILIITHSTKILEGLKIDKVHVLVDGKIVKSGDYSLALEIDKNGYKDYIK